MGALGLNPATKRKDLCSTQNTPKSAIKPSERKIPRASEEAKKQTQPPTQHAKTTPTNPPSPTPPPFQGVAGSLTGPPGAPPSKAGPPPHITQLPSGIRPPTDPRAKTHQGVATGSGVVNTRGSASGVGGGAGPHKDTGMPAAAGGGAGTQQLVVSVSPPTLSPAPSRPTPSGV